MLTPCVTMRHTALHSWHEEKATKRKCQSEAGWFRARHKAPSPNRRPLDALLSENPERPAQEAGRLRDPNAAHRPAAAGEDRERVLDKQLQIQPVTQTRQ